MVGSIAVCGIPCINHSEDPCYSAICSPKSFYSLNLRRFLSAKYCLFPPIKHFLDNMAQFLETDWLAQILVSTSLEAALAVAGHGQGCESNDRCEFEAGICTKAARGIQSIHGGHL